MPGKTRIRGIIQKDVGAILLIAAALKAHELLAKPVTGRNVCIRCPFLILLSGLELGLVIWLISRLFPQADRFATITRLSFFSPVMPHKVPTGASSCNCFGSVHVSPRITLSAIDLPAAPARSLHRPIPLQVSPSSFHRRQRSTIANVSQDFAFW